MLAAQRNYGPDDIAQWSEGDVALGRRLMRLLPEDIYDRQPLIGGGGRYVLVADVRLDNRDELQANLAIDRDTARTSSDSAVLLAAIERWGEGCLERLCGDYAFALWDKSTRQLRLVRDPLGQRPLHFHRGRDFFSFATMPKGLHALPDIPYAPDEERIAQTLALLPETGPRSFFAEISKVECGQIVTVTAQGVSTRRFWQPRSSVIRYKNDNDYIERARELLDEAVRSRLRSDGEVSTNLSGGLDSSAVTATAARLLAKQGKQLLAFTCVPGDGYDAQDPPNRFANEGPLAAATAALYPNVEHVLVPNRGRSPVADLDRSFFLYERPTGGTSSAAWGYSLEAAQAKRKVKCILVGEGGNISLSYDGLDLLSELFGEGRFLRLSREAAALVRTGKMHLRGTLRHAAGPWIPSAIWLWLHRIAGKNMLKLADYSAIGAPRFARLDPASLEGHDFSYRRKRTAFAERLWQLHRIDPGNFRKGGLAGWRFDVRDPMADIRLLEFCLSVPTEQYLRNGITRSFARRVLADRLPKAVLNEERLGLFASDWHRDFDAARSDVVEELSRIASSDVAAGAIDIARLSALVESWPDGGWENEDVVMPYRYVLQRAIAIGHFARRATRSNR